MKTKEWLNDNSLSIDIWNKKYRYNNETFDEWLERVSGSNIDLKQLIYEKKFLFGGRVLSNRNTDGSGSYFNCYSSGYCPDDLKGIMQLNMNLAMTYKVHGGQGLSLTKVRPKGTPVGKRYESDGIIPFLELFNETTKRIAQGSSRKGALMVSLDIEHKEASDFIAIKTEKNKIEKCNLSLEISDDFMKAIKTYYDTGEIITFNKQQEYSGHTVTYDITPINLYKQFAQASYDWAEPAALYTNRFRKYNIMEFVDGYEIETSNPCFTGDMKILTVDGYKTFEELDGKEISIININGDISKSKIWCSGIKEVVEIKLTNNKNIICTSDHIFKLNDMSVCKAIDLTTGKQLKTHIGLDNHFVESVTILSEKMKVYDFTEPITNWGVVEGFIVHNCGEQPLPPDFSCNLGSLNMSEFVENPYTPKSYLNINKFKNAIHISVEALDDIIDENANNHALEKHKENSLNYRNIGLGVMGYATALFKLGYKYGSKQTLEWTDNIFNILFREAVFASNNLAKNKGTFPKYTEKVWESTIIKNHFTDEEICNLKIHGLRNCSLLSIAPTGTIATMLQVSGGCEPQFDLNFYRKTESLHKNKTKQYGVECNEALEYKRINNLSDTDKLPDFFITATNINWLDRIKTQSIMQNHVDTAISSTVNLPNNATIDDVEQLYLKAWEYGLKGITIYRSGCKREGILTTTNTDDTYHYDHITPISRTKIGKTYGTTEKLITACGSLFLTINKDSNGNIVETFTNTSKTGICKSNIDGLNRLISLALRSGVKIEEIIDQLSGINCAACTRVRAKGEKQLNGISCPDIISRSLEKEYKNNKVNTKPITIDDTLNKTEIKSINDGTKCPDCGHKLNYESGCIVCIKCGYSSC